MIEIRRTARFTEWFDTLRDPKTKARITARIFRLQQGNPGDHRELGGGVFELKLDFGPGYRIYCTRRGDTVTVLLVGGDKSTQDRDIATAQAMAKEV